MDLIKEYTPISDEEIERLRNEIKSKYENNLRQFGVWEKADDSYAMYQLIYLYKYKGKAVHKDVVADFVIGHFPNATKDQQVRHLGSQAGYNVLNKGEEYNGEKVPSGYNLLVDLNYPKPDFMARALRRTTTLSSSDFEVIKRSWNYRCATCGEKEGEPHKVSGVIVRLEQGHMDPNLPLGPGNIIPQCQYCNRDMFKNNFVFDENGYPKYINNPNYVLRSPENVKQRMKKVLETNEPEQNEDH